MVLSIIIVLIGIAFLRRLPIEQFPSLSPVQIKVITRLPGASAQALSDSVAAPLEEAINGVENMIYMYSQSVAPGNLSLVVSFKIGTDPNTALINTQNRVNLALSSLPPEVQKEGVVVINQNPSILLFVAIESENDSHDPIFLANYANTNIANYLERINGVSSAKVLNAKDYSIRIWIKPDRLAQFGMTVTDVIRAVQEQNGTHSIGLIGGEPTMTPNQLTIPVTAPGRLKNVEEFENIILRAERDGAMVLLKNVSDVTLGSISYNLVGDLNGKSGAFIGIYQDTAANAIEVSSSVRSKLEELSQFFPEGIVYKIPYDTSNYIKLSISHLQKTLIEAVLLVALVIFIFLHSIRAAIVPIAAMLVSITGAFIGMYLFGFSVNTLTLFGLVLAVGIVVDDAIIVVENIERKLGEKELTPQEAAQVAMKEVTGAVVATACVLGAVFIPVSFLGGITGQFFKQFAITIATSVFLSGFVALTLSPVLSILLLKKGRKKARWAIYFDSMFGALCEFYLKGASFLIRKPLYGIGFFIAMIIATGVIVKSTPIGLVPHEDQGLVLISSSLPDGASLSRVEAVSNQIEKIASQNQGVSDVLAMSGYSLIESIERLQMGAYYINLKNWDERKESAFQIIDSLNAQLSEIPEALITALNPPDIPGIGVVGGFDFWIVNDGPADYEAVNRVVNEIVAKAKTHPEFSKVLTSINANNMELFINLDAVKARSFGVNIDEIYQTLQVLLGSSYINQFNKFGHVYQVVAQAEPSGRDSIEDIGNTYVRSSQNEMIPLKSLIIPTFSKGPTLVQRFNGFPAALVSLIPAIPDPERIVSVMEKIAKETLPPGMSYSWGGLAFQHKETGGMSAAAFLSAFVLIFLVLAALYERWLLPIAILMAVPFGVFGAFLSVRLFHTGANIYLVIGVIALIGLAAKNAILIIEFAKEERKAGKEIIDAALTAARLRFRAIMMTSLTIIVGSLPLVVTTGAGAISRKSVGMGMIGGMAMATFLAVFFVPLFYQGMENLSEWFKNRKK